MIYYYRKGKLHNLHIMRIHQSPHLHTMPIVSPYLAMQMQPHRFIPIIVTWLFHGTYERL